MFCRVNWPLWPPSLGRMKAAMNALKHIRTYLFELQFARHLAVRTGTYCMRNFCVAFIAGTLVLMGSASRAHSQDTSSPTPAATSRTGSHDFDFLVGEWRVHHHRLKPEGEWVDFEGTCSNSKLMDDWANMEEHALNAPNGAYRAIALRAYDSKAGQWAIWWLDGRYPSRPLDPPVKGRFENGIGTFYADYTQDGKPMRGRLLWSNITATSARWEQASSSDGGKTWAPNWIMSWERDTSGHTQAAAARSDSSDFDFLRGEWRVHHRYLRVRGNDREWVEADGTASNRALMGGRANMEEHTINAPAGAYRALALRSYDPKASQWSIWWLDGRSPHGDLDPPVQGRFENGGGTFYGDTTIGGKPVRQRFVWSGITATSARWEQAYSLDTGKTWETNWIMTFTRAK
jgi:hypothetical protein